MKNCQASFPKMLVLLLACAMVGNSWSQEKFQSPTTPQEEDKSTKIVEVIVTGSGLTIDEAIKDALRQAVGQVLGELIDAETRTKNNELISNQILAHAKGLVNKWEVIKSWNKDPVVYQKIKAQVHRKELMMSLNKHGLNPREFDGKKLYAKVVLDLQEEKESRAMLLRLFQDFHTKVLSIAVEGEPKVKGKTDSDVVLGYNLAVNIDLSKYDDFVKKSTPILERLAIRKGEFTLRRNMVRREQDYYNGYLQFCSCFFPQHVLPSQEIVKQSPTLMKIDVAMYPHNKEPWWTKTFDPELHMVVLMNVSQEKGGFESRWAWYHVPLIDLSQNKLGVSVRFRDKAKQSVREDKWILGPQLPGYNSGCRLFLHPKTRQSREGMQIMISPYFIVGPFFGSKVILDRTISISLQDLRQVEDIHCSTESNSAKKDTALLNIKN